jgi:hypothetical protein
MFLALPEVEAHATQLLAEGRHNDALANVMVGAHNTHHLPQHRGVSLFYPGLDRLLAALAAAVPDFATPAPGPGRGTLVIATELYQVGGHTRVVDDILAEAEQPTLVLTDVLGSLRKSPEHLAWVLQRQAELPVIVLQQPTLWSRCRELAQLTQRLAPGCIVYLPHNQDPVAYVGTLGHRGSRKVMMHHADITPCLGHTLPGLVHLDVHQEQADACARALQQPTHVLPLYVPDAPRKTFAPVTGVDFSVVTAGTHVKFQRAGEFALQAVVRTVLQAIGGRFFHIGPLPADWAAEVRQHLAASGLDPERWVTLGPVPSLWDTLAGLDAHACLASVPLTGGRSTIEAQGCGYPVVFRRIGDRQSLLAMDSLYASPDLCWTTLPELGALLRGLAPRLPAAALRSRACYEQHYSRGPFRHVLAEHAGVVLRA